MANGQLTHKQVNTDNWILFAFAALSWVATVVNLIIIKRLRMWNGYLLLITSMAVFQLIYDTSFMMRVIPGYSPCLAWHMMGNIGGIGSSFWTNIMCFIVLYILLKVRSVSIFKIYPLLFLYGGVLPIAFGISSYFALRHTNDDDDGNRGYLYCTFKHDRMATFVNNFYYWGRIFSILFNFFAFVFAWFRLHRMGVQPYYMPGVEVSGLNGATAANTLANSRIGTTGTGADELENGVQQPRTGSARIGANSGILSVQRKHNDPQHVALTVLVSRMKYYPLWQALCRFGSAWNEFRDYKYSTPAISAFAAMTGPSLGLCMFIIFLTVQPGAWEAFLGLICLRKAPKQAPSDQNQIRSARHQFRQEFDFRASTVSVTMPSSFEELSEETLVEIIDDSEIAARYRVFSVEGSMPQNSSSVSRSMFRTGRHLFSTEVESPAAIALAKAAKEGGSFGFTGNFDPDNRRSSGLANDLAQSVPNPILNRDSSNRGSGFVTGGPASFGVASGGPSSFGNATGGGAQSFGKALKRSKSTGVRFSLDDDYMDDGNL